MWCVLLVYVDSGGVELGFFICEVIDMYCEMLELMVKV